MSASSLSIGRPRLAEALQLAIDASPIVAVIAPAGYGKSRAIALGLARLGRPAARYTANAGMPANSPDRSSRRCGRFAQILGG